MKPRTLITVFDKYPGLVIAADSRGPAPAGHIRVEYKTATGQVRAYVLAEHIKERK